MVIFNIEIQTRKPFQINYFSIETQTQCQYRSQLIIFIVKTQTRDLSVFVVMFIPSSHTYIDIASEEYIPKIKDKLMPWFHVLKNCQVSFYLASPHPSPKHPHPTTLPIYTEQSINRLSHGAFIFSHFSLIDRFHTYSLMLSIFTSFYGNK